jgi:Transcription initiation factor IID, 18kD subunit
MMFVSGETAEISMESTILVEQIVQQQVKELVRTALSTLYRGLG